MQNTKRLNESTVEVQCGRCGKTLAVAFTAEQEEKWRAGTLLQKVALNLSLDDREILISGTCGNCWRELFEDEDDD